jgi:hypothetical protein
MSDMIERVAEAIGSMDDWDRCDNAPDHRAHLPAWTEYEDMARAAIEAMREPTDAMAEFAEENFDRDSDDIKVCYRAFIDAALSQSPHSLPSEDR